MTVLHKIQHKCFENANNCFNSNTAECHTIPSRSLLLSAIFRDIQYAHVLYKQKTENLKIGSLFPAGSFSIILERYPSAPTTGKSVVQS